MLNSRLTRRRFLATTAASTAVIAMPHVSHSQAGGKLTVGFWDHWVPGANKASTELCQEWGAKNKVEVQIDYITSQGHKNLLTIAAEQQARSGHDIMAFPTWEPHGRSQQPGAGGRYHGGVDQAAWQSQQDRRVSRACKQRWIVVPTCVGSQIKGPCTRIDLLKKHAGIDVLAMYPAGGAPKADAWTLDAMLKAAEACYKGGNPFGIGLGTTGRQCRHCRRDLPIVRRNLVDAKGDITVKSDQVRQALEYYIKLAQWLPP